MKDELYLVIGIGLLLLVIFSFGLILNGGGGIGGGSTTTDANIGLIDLNDGDSTYSGHGGQFVQALPSEDGWRFIDVNAVSLPDTNATCTVTVSSANADYTNPSDALDAIKSTGGRICISPGVYQLTRPMDINGNSIEIVGSGVSTVIRTNPISIPTAIRIPTGSQTTYILLSNLAVSASSSLGNGTAIDFSNCAICKIRDIYINGYNHGIDFNKSNTFYNTVENVRISVSGPGAFGIRFQNSANDNTVFRTRILADGNTLGVTIKNAHGNSLYEVNVESLAYIGIDINTGANDISVYAPYLESNNINLSIAPAVYGFYLSGGSIQSGATANIQDLGADKPIMTGMKLGFASAPSTFGDINALDLNTSTQVCIKGDCRSAWPTGSSSGSCDNNVNCTITGKITTNLDINAKNIKFTGVLSGGDFNYALSDANSSQNCGNNLALNSVGQTTGCISVPNESNIDANALAIVNALDLNNSLAYIKTDTNCSNNTNCILTGRINTGFDANFQMDVNIGIDLNVHGNTFIDKNIYIDGNQFNEGDINFSGDKNHSIGQSGSGNVFFNALQYIANIAMRGANLIINGNTYAFCIKNTNPCSGFYFSSSDGIRGFRLDISGVPIWYIGTGGGAGVTFQGSRTSNPTVGSGAGQASSIYVLDTTISAQSSLTDGNILMINQGTTATQAYERIGARQIDLNLGMKINHVTGTNKCAGMATLTSGIVTVNTTCMEDSNSMVMLTKQGKKAAGVTPLQVENQIFGTSFDIRDSNAGGDANVFWTISKLFGT